jgi:hypothetical protein
MKTVEDSLAMLPDYLALKGSGKSGDVHVLLDSILCGPLAPIIFPKKILNKSFTNQT